MILRITVFFFFAMHALHGQNYPQDFFKSPLNIPLALSGTFGELRGNHFHSGMDIKTQGREGLDVMAAAPGRIVRIKVSAYGYGNTLYMVHPNGYTTVYAHLQSFHPDIEAWVKKQQYAKQSFEVNLFPPGIFAFEQGEIIAKSGNSGGSGGPHLHFEIRDSKTEETINPALFGLPVEDSKKPYIGHVYASPISAGALVNNSTSQKEIALTNLGNGVYTGSFVGSGGVGFVVHTFDQQNLSNNHNGIYEIEQYVNDTLTYRFKVEKFAFSETRYINAHMDFARYKSNRQLAHKTYVEPGNKLSLYSNLKNKGGVLLKPNRKTQITILVRDSWGNTSEIRLQAEGKEQATLTAVPENELKWASSNTIKLDGIKVELGSGTLYKNEVIELTQKAPCTNCLSSIYTIGEETIPAHKRYNLSIHKEQLTTTDRLVWATLDGTKPTGGLTTTWQGDWLVARPRTFGSFAVMQDTVRPTYSVSGFANNAHVKPGKEVRFTATDNLSGITSYKATIDGKWVLLQHDAKRNLYWHTFEENLIAGSHVLTVIFKDEVGNIASYQAVFTYQPE